MVVPAEDLIRSDRCPTGRRAHPLARAARLAVTILTAGLAAALGGAAPAAAHGADAPVGTNYRAQVLAVTPAVSGLTVRSVEAGARLELVNRSGHTVEVLGYTGEPYLEIRPDGVFQNLNSPATYLNRTLTGETPPPAGIDPAKPPNWQRISTEPVARWHDQRTLWLDRQPPAAVQAQPGRPHRVREWSVPLRVDLAPAEIRGALDWLPPPDPARWWLLSLAGALALSTLGLVDGRRQDGRLAPRILGVLAILGGTAAIVLAVGRQLTTGTNDPLEFLAGLLSGQTWPLAAGIGALAAGGYALARRPAADFALALAGACLALFAGVVNAVMFNRAVIPLPWPAPWSRALVAAVLALGAALMLANVLRMHVAAQVSRGTPPGTASASTEPPPTRT